MTNRRIRPFIDPRRLAPAIQNVPIRTELGREIRAALLPRLGSTPVVADYASIEARVAAYTGAR